MTSSFCWVTSFAGATFGSAPSLGWGGGVGASVKPISTAFDNKSCRPVRLLVPLHHPHLPQFLVPTAPTSFLQIITVLQVKTFSQFGLKALVCQFCDTGNLMLPLLDARAKTRVFSILFSGSIHFPHVSFTTTIFSPSCVLDVCAFF